MQYVNGLIAIGGDLRNCVYRENMSIPEVEVLRRIHGESAVTEIRVVNKGRVAHDAERERLMQKFPKQTSLVIDLYRDYGGKFPNDIRDLKLEPSAFARASTVAFDQAEVLESMAGADEELDDDED